MWIATVLTKPFPGWTAAQTHKTLKLKEECTMSNEEIYLDQIREIQMQTFEYFEILKI